MEISEGTQTVTRNEFTYRLSKLLITMFEEGEKPLLDYVKRSPQEQKRLYDAGLSKCDGYMILSRHQSGKAADIYFLNHEETELEDPYMGFEYWHSVWESMGGSKAIPWDPNHFEA